jgi:hypothetical protein
VYQLPRSSPIWHHYNCVGKKPRRKAQFREGDTINSALSRDGQISPSAPGWGSPRCEDQPVSCVLLYCLARIHQRKIFAFIP